MAANQSATALHCTALHCTALHCITPHRTALHSLYTQVRNKMYYTQAGSVDLLKAKWKKLSEYITLECDGQDITHKLKEHKVRNKRPEVSLCSCSPRSTLSCS